MHSLCHLGRAGDAAHGGVTFDVVAEVAVVPERVLERAAHDAAKGQCVHADMVGGQRDRHGSGHLVERGGADRKRQKIGVRAGREDRGQVDDGTGRVAVVALFFGLFDHALGDHLGHAQAGHHVLLEQLLDRVIFGVQGVRGQNLTRCVDQDVDAIKRVDGGRKQVRLGQTFAQITGKELDVVLFLGHVADFGLELRFVHVGEHDVRTLVGKVAADGQADAVGRPCDDCRLALDGKTHTSKPLGKSAALAAAARAHSLEHLERPVTGDL